MTRYTLSVEALHLNFFVAKPLQLFIYCLNALFTKFSNSTNNSSIQP